MHELYQQHCEQLNQSMKPVHLTKYRTVFATEINVEEEPKKDQCNLCERYFAANTEERASLQERYDEHFFQKDGVSGSKKADCNRDTKEKIFVCATFVHCFLWNELEGKRGNTEIGTCIAKYLELLPDNIQSKTFYSDSCGDQNRNQYIAVILLNMVQMLPVNFSTLTFLETGHTQMECDSMHSAIELVKKSTKDTLKYMNVWLRIIALA